MILNALAHELDFPTLSIMELNKLEDSSVKPNVVDSLMGITMEVSTACTECDQEPVSVKVEGHRKLICNIQGGHGESVKVSTNPSSLCITCRYFDFYNTHGTLFLSG